MDQVEIPLELMSPTSGFLGVGDANRRKQFLHGYGGYDVPCASKSGVPMLVVELQECLSCVFHSINVCPSTTNAARV